MSDLEFLTYPLISGIAIAFIAGILGVFMVWRRMSFVGDTLSHSALLGVSVALWVNVAPYTGILFLGLLIALLIAQDDQGKILGSDTLLGIISQASLASGIIISTSMVDFRVDLLGYLYGDILSVTESETYQIIAFKILIGLAVLYCWRKFVAISLNSQLARVSGINVKLFNIIYLLLLVSLVGVGMRLVGVLLITSLLVIPSATARYFTRTPESMAVTAGCIGALSVGIGLWASLYFDWPSGPTIVITSLCFWVIGYWKEYISKGI